MVTEIFDPRAEPDGSPSLTVSCVLRHDSATARSRHGEDEHDLAKDLSSVSIDVEAVWCVTHLVNEIPGEELIVRKPNIKVKSSESQLSIDITELLWHSRMHPSAKKDQSLDMSSS